MRKLYPVTFLCINLWVISTFAQPPGSLDPTFDSDGKQTVVLGPSIYGSECSGIAVLPGGKIVLAGRYHNGSDMDFGLVRLTTSGTLDNTFDGDGIVITNLGDDERGNAVAVQPDGKILVAGSRYTPGNWDFCVMRYNVDGSLDMSFDGDGITTTDFSNNHEHALAILLQPDGKIIVSGETYIGSDQFFAIVRYNPDGSADNSFDGDGQLTTDMGLFTDDQARSIALQSDGKIVVGGNAGYDFALARYNIDGSLDNTFDSDGRVTTNFSGNISIGHSVAIEPGGKIILAGTLHLTANYNFAAARYNTDGSLDNSFDGDGKLDSDFSGASDNGYAVSLQADGKILIAGTATNSPNYSFGLIRYNYDGIVDSTFGTDGRVTTNFNGFDPASRMTIQPDGKILVAGYTSDTVDVFAVARYSPGQNIGLPDFSVENNSISIYPNPVNEMSWLEYTLRSKENISIQLSDAQGSVIRTFITNEKQEIGIHSLQLHFPNNLPPGQYYIILRTLTGKASIKIIK